MESATVPIAAAAGRAPRRARKAPVADIDRIEECEHRLALVRSWIVQLAENGTIADDAASGAILHLFDTRDLLRDLIAEREGVPS